MVVIRKVTQALAGMWRKLNPQILLVTRKMIWVLWKIVWQFFLKLDMNTYLQLSNFTLNIYQREIKVCVDKRLVNVHRGIIHNRQKVGTLRTV